MTNALQDAQPAYLLRSASPVWWAISCKMITCVTLPVLLATTKIQFSSNVLNALMIATPATILVFALAVTIQTSDSWTHRPTAACQKKAIIKIKSQLQHNVLMDVLHVHL